MGEKGMIVIAAKSFQDAKDLVNADVTIANKLFQC
jgi:hypothetical protein